MKNIKKFVMIALMLITLSSLFTSCTSKNKQNVKVDTIPIVKFTDKEFDTENKDIIQKSISQRTGNVNTFIVEYWYKSTKESKIYHYGYLVKLDNEKIIIIKEGKDVNNTIFLE